MNDPFEKSNPTQAEYFKDIVGTIRDPLVVLDAGLRVLAANRSFYKTFKVKPKETTGALIYDLGNRQWDIPSLRTLLETILPKKAIFNDYQVEHDFPSIGKRILLLNARRIPAPPKEAKWILLAFEDVTERKELERKLQASEQRFRRAFETAQDGMLLIEKTGGQVLNSNQSAEDMLGHSKQALQKKNLWELGILKDAGQFRQTALQLEEQGLVRLPDLTIPTRRGGYFPADVNMMDRAAVIQCNIRDISERKQSEGVIHDLARFPSEDPNPVLRIARDGNLLYANEAAFHLLANWKLEPGKPAPEVLRNPALEVIETQKGKTVNIPHGEQILSISIEPGPKSEDVSLYVRDVTKREQAEQKSRLLASIIESASDAIIGKTLEGTILSWNPGAEKLYGYPAGDIIGKSISIIVPPEKADEFAEILKIIGRDERVENYETERLTKAGRRVNVSLTISPIVDEGGRVVGASTIAHDITEQKKAKGELILANQELAFQEEKIRKLNTELEATVEKRTAQLQETLELNQKMIEASSLGIFACRADGPCVIANPAIARISGAPVEKMLQLNFRKMESWKKNGLFDKVEAALATRKEQHAEIHLTTFFLRDAWVNYYITTFASNGALHFLMLVDEITERKQAEQALQQRTVQLEAANKELEAFSYSVSHDLRSPLRAIDGFSRILIEEYASQLPAESRRYLDLVRSNTQKMGELVDDLLAFSRLGRQPLKKQTVSPEDIVRKSLEDLRTELEGRQVEIVIGELPDCEGDPALLKQVFINLLSNALKFTSKRQVARIEVGFEEKDGKRAYYVRDNGVGFDMLYVGKLFGVFQRLHRAEDYEGTGVGLAIVQRIVTRHGGQARAEAEVDKGATFYFTLEGGESNE